MIQRYCYRWIFFFFFNYWRLLIYILVLVSGIQQSDSVTHIFSLFQIHFPYVITEYWVELPMLYRRSCSVIYFLFFFFFSFIFISWRLITSQHFSGFCHTLTWINHGVTCIPHPDPPSHLPLHPIPLDLPSAPGPSTCLMCPTWAGDLFHYR